MSLPELPDEMLLRCVDGSMRICVKVAGACKTLRFKLQLVTALRGLRRGLRLVANHLNHAMQIKKQLRGSFHIGELVIKDEAWPFIYWHATVLELYTYCEKLHTIRVNPMHACKVKELYDTDEHGELTEMKQSGAFQIVAGPVQDIPFIVFKGRQLMITDMKWLA